MSCNSVYKITYHIRLHVHPDTYVHIVPKAHGYNLYARNAVLPTITTFRGCKLNTHCNFNRARSPHWFSHPVYCPLLV